MTFQAGARRLLLAAALATAAPAAAGPPQLRQQGTAKQLIVHDEPFLIIPYTLETNDMRFATPQGFNSGDQFFTYLKDAFDVLYQEGKEGSPKMLNVGLHCRIVGRPGRARALDRFLEHVRSREGVWVTTRAEIARHWHAEHPPR